MLGLLRNRDPTGLPAPDLAQLPALLAGYRSAGLDVGEDIGPLGSMPRLVSTMAYRIAAEALTNAQRHSAPGTVRLVVRHRRGRVTIDSSNLLAAEQPAGRSSGHGLQGIAERVALFGGTVEAGATDGEWRLRAVIPTGVTGE